MKRERKGLSPSFRDAGRTVRRVPGDRLPVPRPVQGEPVQFMKLTTAEAAAINCHMGFSDGNPNAVRDVGNAYHQFPLAWVIHAADEAATFLLDR